MKKLNNILNKIILLWPIAILFGIFDYRFSQHYYPNLSQHFQIFTSGFFDHTSTLTIYAIITTSLLIISTFLNKKELDTNIQNFKKILPIFLLILISLISTIIFKQQYPPVIQSPPQSIILFWTLPFLATFLSLNYIQTHNLNAKLIRSATATLFGFSTIILIQFFTEILPGETTNHLGRLNWPYIDPFNIKKTASPNLLAYIFSPSIIFNIYQFSKTKNSLNLILVLASSLILILTQSYTAILTTSFVIFIFFFKKLTNKKKILLTISSILILFLITLTQYNTPKFQILLGKTNNSNSISERTKIYKVSQYLIQKTPITGLGISNFQKEFKAEQSKVLDQEIIEREIPPHPHNLLLHIWSEIGIFAMTAFLYIYIKALISILNFKQTETPLHIMLALYFCLHGLVDVPLFLEEHFYIYTSIILSFLILNHSNKSLSSN